MFSFVKGFVEVLFWPCMSRALAVQEKGEKWTPWTRLGALQFIALSSDDDSDNTLGMFQLTIVLLF